MNTSALGAAFSLTLRPRSRFRVDALAGFPSSASFRASASGSNARTVPTSESGERSPSRRRRPPSGEVACFLADAGMDGQRSAGPRIRLIGKELVPFLVGEIAAEPGRRLGPQFLRSAAAKNARSCPAGRHEPIPIWAEDRVVDVGSSWSVRSTCRPLCTSLKRRRRTTSGRRNSCDALCPSRSDSHDADTATSFRSPSPLASPSAFRKGCGFHGSPRPGGSPTRPRAEWRDPRFASCSG